MKLYPRLAWEGIRKNRRLYLPYLLTCAGMVMMFYIIHYLAALPVLLEMAGGRTTTSMLGFGTWIVALFSLIFLLYTNSFLIRRRKKEFGLYNILGMGKRNLCMVYLWETGILFALSVAAGLLGGILLSKLAELALFRLLSGTAAYTFTVSRDALKDTFLIFVPIFGLILLRGLWQLRRMSAVALLRSESVGEKPPRANWLLGLGGTALLAAAYGIAVSIQNPLVTLAWFFLAVGMVIVATYLLFIAGSVLLCRLLQKNRGYYYQKNHFVSVSSMVYRMKRNGAGLASICILSTMVLVLLLSTGSLYFGTEDSLYARYPREIGIYNDYLSGQTGREYAPEKVDEVIREMQAILDDFGVEPRNEERYLCAYDTGLLRDGVLLLNTRAVDDLAAMGDVCTVCFIALDDYNRTMGTHETLAEDEALVYGLRRAYTEPAFTMGDGTAWRIRGQVEDMMVSGNIAVNTIPAVFLVVPDLDRAVRGMGEQGEQARIALIWNFDTGLDTDGQIALADALYGRLRELSYTLTGNFYSFGTDCREARRGDFYGTYGGIFYLGILLSIVFLAATALIIYYKQVTEGYEDENRFAIMRKVGMTREDIRRSVNSQLRTVFFLPLVIAAVHLGFAFPMVRQLLSLFSLRNTPLMLAVAGGAVLLFAVIYALIYRATSNAYCAIVSGQRED